MKAGWTSLGDITPARRPGADPWVGGTWRFTDVRAGAARASSAPTPAGAGGDADLPPATGTGAETDTAPATGGARPARRRRGRTVSALLAVAVVSGAAGGLVADRFDDSDGSTDTLTVIGADPSGLQQRPPDSVAGVAAKVLPSVVSVSVNNAAGSGFVIAEEGYILTNNHVVAAADDGTVGLTLFDGRRFEADVVGTSASYDVAVLQIDADDLTPVVFGDSASVAVGDPVVAIGNPLGLDATVTSGIVSAVERPVTAGGPVSQSYINALQTDAAINPGNSGGPLVDSAGRVIGVNSAIASLGAGGAAGSIGLGFAIPIEQVRRTAEQLISNGEAVYPIMGVLLDNGYSGPGAQVADGSDDGPGVTPGGPADDVGIRSGDVIVEIDGERVRSPAELIVRLRAHRPGDDVTLTVERDDDVLEFTLTLDAAVG